MRLLTKSLLSAAIGLSPFAAFAADSSISSVTATSSDTSLSATNNITVTFTTTAPITTSDNITASVWSSDGASLNHSLDFSGVTTTGIAGYTTNTQLASDSLFGEYTFDAMSIALSSDLPAGTYTLILENVVNTATAADFTIGVSTAHDQDLIASTSYTFSNIFSVTDVIPVSEAAAIEGLKVKNITTNSATLKWNAFTGDNEVTYTVVLFKKNGEKVKTFTGLTTLKKEIAKSTKFLKAGKSYKFKVKACDIADAENCTSFSEFKAFTMKTAE